MWTLIGIALVFLALFVWHWIATLLVILVVLYNIVHSAVKVVTYGIDLRGVIFGLISALPNIIVAIAGIAALIWACT